MLTGDIRNQVDQDLEELLDWRHRQPDWGDEQITYLLFIRRLDELQTQEERAPAPPSGPVERWVFPEGKDTRGRSYEDLRWSKFRNDAPSEMFVVVGEHVFPFLRTLISMNSIWLAVSTLPAMKPANAPMLPAS